MYESDDKMVSHPDHYMSKTGMEAIDVIKAFTDGLSGIEAYDTGNIIKYALRWKNKGGVQDLEKIIWYAQHLVDYLKDKNKSDSIMPRSVYEAEVDAFKEAMDMLNKIESNERGR